MRIVEWFGGIGAATHAFKKANIPHEIVDYVEIDKYAVQSYNIVNNTNFKPKDINNIDTSTYGDVDLLIAGWPCLFENTLIKTKNGFKEIKNVIKGDYVRTHNDNWKKVEDVWETGAKEIWYIESQLNNIETTCNHKWYVLRDDKHQWIRTDELNLADKFIHQINDNEKNIDLLTDAELFIMGVYAGDGNKIKDGTNKALNGISLTVSNKQIDRILEWWPTAKVYKKNNTNKAVRIDIRNRALAEKTLKYIGEYSHLKEIHNDIIDLPKKRLNIFFDGYLSADGSKDKERNRYSFTTVSKKMALGLQEIALKLYKVPVNWTEPKNHRSWGKRIKYQLDFTTPNKINNIDKYFYANIKSIQNTKENKSVWDMNVQDDHSFYANNIITHNCQDYSIAGYRKGLDGDRSSLILTTIDQIEKMSNKPKYILLENVKGLLGKKHKEDLELIKESFCDLGYQWEQVLLNAKYFGIPQSRERIYMLLTRNDLPKISLQELKERKEVKRVLGDILDYSEPSYGVDLQDVSDVKDVEIKPIVRSAERELLGVNGQSKTIDTRCDRSPLIIFSNENDQYGKLYFTNELSQYNGKTIELDLEKFHNQNRDKINKVATIGTIVNGEIKSGYAQFSRLMGIEGLSYTLLNKNTTSSGHRVLFKNFYEKDSRVYGINGQNSTLTQKISIQRIAFKNNYKINYRKLSTLECWRLMGFSDEAHNKIKSTFDQKGKRVISDAQLGKQAGNSIVVDVLVEIIRKIKW